MTLHFPMCISNATMQCLPPQALLQRLDDRPPPQLALEYSSQSALGGTLNSQHIPQYQIA